MCATALQMAESLIRIGENQPELLLGSNLDLPGMRLVQRELHNVYFAHLFACFESDIRDYWRAIGRTSEPKAKPLLNSIAARQGVPQDTLDTLQDIREFRNFLVHGSRKFKKPYSVDEASGYINTYIARLPLQW